MPVKRPPPNDACAPSTKSRIDKLGVKDGHDVLVLGIEDDVAFMAELRERGARTRTSGRRPADVIFAAFRHRDDLRRLAPLVPSAAAGRHALDAPAERIEGSRPSRR